MDRHRRPPSYSDSLLYLPETIHSEPLFKPLINESIHDPLPTDMVVPSKEYTPYEKWYNRFMGFGLHLTLISLFETVFFFHFVSQSEDAGLRSTVDSYVNGVLNSCGNWTANTTVAVDEALSLFINVTDVYQQNQIANISISQHNSRLQLQAWMYVAGLCSAVAIGAGVGRCAKLRLAWRRILIENLIMVTLLGLYEYTFFDTIIFKYDNMSTAQLNEFIVNQLQQTCGLLTPPSTPSAD